MNENLPYRRVCLYGGPGTGKSTMAHYLCYRLKRDRFEAEYAREWCKRAAYQLPENSVEQGMILQKQFEEEMEALETGACVVTDSPIWLQMAYTEGDTQLEAATKLVAQGLDIQFPTLHVMLDRGDRPFVQTGRWHNEEESKQKDKEILDLLGENGVPVVHYQYDSYDELYERISKGTE